MDSYKLKDKKIKATVFNGSNLDNITPIINTDYYDWIAPDLTKHTLKIGYYAIEDNGVYYTSKEYQFDQFFELDV